MSYKLGKPIQNSVEDILSRSKFALSIANSINEYSEPDMIALGLNGSWGTGKSSVINLIKEQIDTEKYDIVEFNPWYYSSRKQLITDFFTQLALVKGETEENKKLVEDIVFYGNFLSLSVLIPEPRLKFIGILGVLMTGMGSLIKTKLEKSKNDINEIKENLNSKLKENKKTLVIIDEIDRLETNDIKEIFQLVRALGDLTNVVYFLSYDIGVIHKAFDDKERYIDKIINVQFDIPKADSEDFFNYLSKELETNYTTEINAIREENYEKVMDVIKDIGFNNLREVNKLLNFFKITYKPIGENINFGDYLLLCFVKCQKPTYYETIYINRDRLSSFDKKDDVNLKKIINAFEKNKKDSRSYKRLIDDKYCNTYFEYNFKNGSINAEAFISKDYGNIENNLEDYDYLVNLIKNFDEIFIRLDKDDITFYFELFLKKLNIFKEKKDSYSTSKKETLQEIVSKEIIRLIKKIDTNEIEKIIKKYEIEETVEIKPIIDIFTSVKKRLKKDSEINEKIINKIEKYLVIKEFNYEIYKNLSEINKLGCYVKEYIERSIKEEEIFIKILRIIGDMERVQTREEEYEDEYHFFRENIPKERYLNQYIIETRIKTLSNKTKKEYSQLLEAYKNREWENEEENRMQYEQEEYFELDFSE